MVGWREKDLAVQRSHSWERQQGGQNGHRNPKKVALRGLVGSRANTACISTNTIRGEQRGSKCVVETREQLGRRAL